MVLPRIDSMTTRPARTDLLEISSVAAQDSKRGEDAPAEKENPVMRSVKPGTTRSQCRSFQIKWPSPNIKRRWRCRAQPETSFSGTVRIKQRFARQSSEARKE